MGPEDDLHPLLLELASLRQTAAQFQHEAHTAAINLQHHAVDASRLYEHIAALEQENARLTHELGALRAHPDVQPHPAEAQVHDLTLALRRVSEKITLTECTLLERTSELTETRSELARARHTADGAYELAARMRAREEASKARERELEFRARASEEERKMVDLVVQEYADLVRNLEGRRSSNPNHTSPPNGPSPSTILVDNLQDDKCNLHNMLNVFSAETESLHATIAELNATISNLQLTLDTERHTATNERTSLSHIRTELDRLNIEDQTAAKMVARYMKFSQASTNALQQQITTLRARHTSTISTLEVQMSIAESQLASERAQAARLQCALDELCEDLARESYGRRREVSLRLALLSREEGVAELMRRWVRRAKELYAKCYSLSASSEDAIQEAFHRVVSDAEAVLSSLDDDVQFSDAVRTTGSLARIALSKDAVESLRNELQNEVQKRVEAIRKASFSVSNGHSVTENPPQREGYEGKGPPNHVLLMPNGDTEPKRKEASLVSLPSPQGSDSPISMVEVLEESFEDPSMVPASLSTETIGLRDYVSCPLQDGASASATFLPDEGPHAVQDDSPVVSVLDLRQELYPSDTDELHATSIHALPNDISISSLDNTQNVHILDEIDTSIPSTSIPTSIPAASEVPSPSGLPTLLSELNATKHRYDDLQHAFRDCCLALKDTKRMLAAASPSSAHSKLRHYLETALARIDDYAEDARVELEIRIADEELALRGFETVLAVPGALADPGERADIEASARAFVDGTDEGVVRALQKFGKKLEEVEHDLAAVKRAVHGLAMDGTLEGEEGEERTGAGAGWTAWTASLLGGDVTPTRSPTPVQTFGAVMTSPRLRFASSLKHAQEGTEQSPLAGLNLRIPMPSPSSAYAPYGQLGLGRMAEGRMPKRTLSTMYAVGGLRSSSTVGLGVGFGGSPSPARPRGLSGRLEVPSSLSLGGGHDLGGVE